MGKKIINKSKKQIIKELKEKEDDGKRNITFSLDSEVIKAFKDECKNHGLTMNKVVEKLMIEFVKAK
jgi:uncharacterized protein (DUF4415 family)